MLLVKYFCFFSKRNCCTTFIPFFYQTGTGKTLAFLLPAFLHIDGQET